MQSILPSIYKLSRTPNYYRRALGAQNQNTYPYDHHTDTNNSYGLPVRPSGRIRPGAGCSSSHGYLSLVASGEYSDLMELAHQVIDVFPYIPPAVRDIHLQQASNTDRSTRKKVVKAPPTSRVSVEPLCLASQTTISPEVNCL